MSSMPMKNGKKNKRIVYSREDYLIIALDVGSFYMSPTPPKGLTRQTSGARNSIDYPGCTKRGGVVPAWGSMSVQKKIKDRKLLLIIISEI